MPHKVGVFKSMTRFGTLADDVIRETCRIMATLHYRDWPLFVYNIAKSSSRCLRAGKLVPLDEAMLSDLEILYRETLIRIPIRRINESVLPKGDNHAFGNIREMYCNDVYLWPFKELPVGGTVLDLGSNRGFFVPIAAKTLKAELIVSVEPLERYNEPYYELLAANYIDPSLAPRLKALVGDGSRLGTATLGSLLQPFDVDTISFLKCDIEGAEFQLFEETGVWLESTENIAMEVHQDFGDVQSLISILKERGFRVLCFDRRRKSATPETADYLFASKNVDAFF